tara:strand:+ start:1747 stop:2298 length:552 start_codon:yes stop_codon:yes gene_type:complete
VKLAYADPPYSGHSHLYKDHSDYGGEVDHHKLIGDLASYDGFVLHTSSSALGEILAIMDYYGPVLGDYRVLAWVKQFASWKPGNRVQYAWEPVILKAARPPVQRPDQKKGQSAVRDWLMEPMATQKGIVGAKPKRLCWWLFDCLGAQQDDDLADLFPGSGDVTDVWQSWRTRQRPELQELELL